MRCSNFIFLQRQLFCNPDANISHIYPIFQVSALNVLKYRAKIND